jgi:hypothetical protein
VSTYKISAIEKIDSAYLTLCASLRTQDIIEVAKAFVGNTERVVSAATFPSDLVDFLAEFWSVWRRAQERLTGTYDPQYPSSSDQWVAAHSQMPDECKKVIQELPVVDPKMPRRFSREWLKGRGKTLEAGYMHPGWLMLEAMVACSDDLLAYGVESVLSSMIVGMWTAFESMASDLWETALNVQPMGLAQLSGTDKRISKLAGEETKGDGDSTESRDIQESQRDSKSIPLDDIQRLTGGTYDLGHKMGSLLKGRFRFTTLAGIRQAYSAAFSEKEKKARTDTIDAALSSKGFNSLSVVRNVIVHKAGVADGEYRKKLPGAPLAPDFALGQKLKLDGEVCRILIDSVTESSVRLIKGVDSWLQLLASRR